MVETSTATLDLVVADLVADDLAVAVAVFNRFWYTICCPLQCYIASPLTAQ